MFPQKFRLPAQTSFGTSRSCNLGSFSLKVKKNNETYNRYGFVVSKKVDLRATKRNEVKRKFRSVLENCHTTLSQGYDLLFIVKQAAKEKTFVELEKEINEALRKCLNSNP